MAPQRIDADPQLYVIGPRAGERPQVEAMVSMLQTSRRYLVSASRDLDAERLTDRPAGVANSIGALLSHAWAAERMFQNLLFRGYQFADDEQDDVAPAFSFERDPHAGRPSADYHAALEAARGETLALFDEVDDAWLAHEIPFAGQPSNRHYYWLHYLLDEARHTGQIVLLRKRLIAAADPDFFPYAIR